MATQREVQELKWEWSADPCYDIEATPGFEDHREELLAFRKQMEARWQGEAQRQLNDYAARLGTDNLTLAAYVRSLEERIAKLEG